MLAVERIRLESYEIGFEFSSWFEFLRLQIAEDPFNFILEFQLVFFRLVLGGCRLYFRVGFPFPLGQLTAHKYGSPCIAVHQGCHCILKPVVVNPFYKY